MLAGVRQVLLVVLVLVALAAIAWLMGPENFDVLDGERLDWRPEP